jgi:2-isopropylmalate synthase
VQAGALVINCPDTIGSACSVQGNEYFVQKMAHQAALIRKEFPDRSIIWSAHCHNDFGLATQNSLNAVFDGPARQVEGCINGIGERAGNVALEQVVMAIRHFGALANPSFPYFTNVHTEHFGEICEFVSRHMLPVQPHWPVSGRNAMRHSAGGHTNAILKNPLIYQPFDPKEVGKEISLVFGPLSGGNHSQSIVRSFGYDVKDDEKHEIAQYIKDRYQDRRKGVTDEEVLSAYIEYRSPIHIDEIDYSRSKSRSFVLLKGRFFEIEGEMTETHEGQDSALAALKKAIDVRFPGLEIQSHKSSSDGEGIAALSISKIILTDSGGDLFEGTGEDRDIEISAMKALISAVNRAFVDSRFRIPE